MLVELQGHNTCLIDGAQRSHMAYISGATYTQLLTDGYTKNQLCVPNCSGVPPLIVL